MKISIFFDKKYFYRIENLRSKNFFETTFAASPLLSILTLLDFKHLVETFRDIPLKPKPE